MNADAASGVFLTGGTGLVGSHIAARLREEGVPVRALCRATAPKGHLRRIGALPVEGDVRDSEDDLVAALGDASVVVHAAAVVYGDLSWPRLRALNVDGARKVARAAARAGARHLVHISSVAVYGPTEGPLDETDPLETPLRPGDLYARSKRQAEEAVRSVARDSGLPISILRPAVLYGERDRFLTPRLGRLLRLPVIPIPGPGTAPLPVVYAGNVADCVATLVERRAALVAGAGPDDEESVETYNLASDHPLHLRGLLTGLAEGMGRRPPRFLSVPLRMASTGARAAEVLNWVLPGRRDLPPFRRAVQLAGDGNPYRSERVREVLEWAPPFTVEEALGRTGEWLAGQ